MSGLVYAPWISLEDKEEIQIPINPNLRAYLEDPNNQVHEDDTSIYTLDITNDTLSMMEMLSQTENERSLVKTIKDKGYGWINVEPHIYFVFDDGV